MFSKPLLARREPLPVTLISGFLGAGKTTLLNHLLSQIEGRRVVVLVNDFGAINIDSQLIVSRSPTLLALANGCICCTVESDLLAQLEQLLGPDGPQPEHLLIEASGVANPQKIANTLRYPQFRQRLYLDAIITLVDAVHYSELPQELAPLALEQLDVADLIVLNKADLASPAQRQALREQWLYPAARVFECEFGQVPAEVLLGHGGSLAPAQLSKAGPIVSLVAPPSPHSSLLAAHSIRCDQPLRLAALRQFLWQLPAAIYRVKGIVQLAEQPQQCCVVQQVGQRCELTLAGPWPRNTSRRQATSSQLSSAAAEVSQLVFIGLRAQLDPVALEAALQACQQP